MNAGPAVDPRAFLEGADRIGQRLLRDATWSGDQCSWNVQTLDHGAPLGRQRSVAAPSGPALYQGTAGIALFLAELARLSGDHACRRAARGAIHHALNAVQRMPPALVGLYSGRVGVAFAAARVGTCLGDDRYLEEAWRLIRTSVGLETDDRALDLVGGGAGALLALLNLAGGALEQHRVLLVAAAERMGDHLISMAKVEPVGWSWPTIAGVSRVRNLVGYAHGASGFAHAFVELFKATGALKYRYAAVQAMAYERRWYHPEHRNWPDFRHHEVMEDFAAGGISALLERLRGGGYAPYRPTYMNAWCHGAPGIALARIRSYGILGDPVLEEEARSAIETTADSLNDSALNDSLCHGRFGNAEVLLLSSDALDDAAGRNERRAKVVAFAAQACDARETTGRAWKSGTLDNLHDPSLLVGEAGIGHFLLRLSDPGIPPVLCVTTEGLPAVEESGHEAAERLAEAAADRFFRRTRATFIRRGSLEESARWPPSGDGGGVEAFEELRRIVSRESDQRVRAELADAFRPEQTRFERAANGFDSVAIHLDLLGREDPASIDWTTCTYALSPRAELVTGLSESGESASYLAYDTPDGVELTCLGHFAAAVLERAAFPTSVSETCEEFGRGGAAPEEGALLQARVTEQVVEAYRAGIIEVQRPEAAADS